MTVGRRGDWCQTYTGIRFWPLDPRAEEVSIADIAHALANLCRFAGHCDVFYSVAQHSVLVSRLVPAKHALWGLLHDAAEAYVTDVPRPLKRCLPGYVEIEAGVQHAVAKRFGLPWPEPPEVKRADNALLAAEARQLMSGASLVGWHLPEPPADAVIEPWAPECAEVEFFDRFRALMGDRA